MRWRLFAGALLLAALLPMPAARASVPVLVIDGKGFGHGVGMAQDGAFWMGMLGSSTNDILGHFYPGTRLGRSGGTVRVAVHDGPNRDTVVTFPSGGEVRDASSGARSAGFPVSVGPGGQVHVWFDGAYHAAAVGGGARMSMSLASAVRPQVGTVTTTTLLPQT